MLTCRRAALLLALSVPIFCGLSCAPKTAPIAFRTPHPAPPTPHPVLPRVAARPKALQPIAFPDLETNQISALVFSPDGRRLVLSYGADAGVSLWNLDTGRLGWQRHVNAADGGAVRFTSDGRFMISQFGDPDADTPVIVSTLEGRLVQNLGSYFMGGGVEFEKLGKFLIVVGSQTVQTNERTYWHAVHLVEVWNTHTWHQVDHVKYNPNKFLGPVRLMADGKIIRHVDIKQPAKPWQPPSAVYAYTDATADGNYLATADDATGDSNKQVEVWDMRSRRLMWAKTFTDDTPRVPAISPDGRTVAVATLRGYVYFWNLKTGRLLAKTNCSTDVLRCLAFSPNGRVLVVAGGLNGSYDDATEGVHLLDTATYKVFAVLKVSLAETPDGEAKDWSLNHPDWLVSLPDLSYIASAGVVKKIRTPGRARDAKIVARFDRPARVRAALRKAWE